ncbi:hypothetical protein [Gracilinema caldarium]|uniref:Uncharacterized protein n=1 Tax=Gracilinema caldarium (strain ATCC 51460 / DSM 7334 / H1) TaxID=744872 RepID=F8EWR4_GRAC1|nr:hypothetical protein [Gracilinema caldarium]AEJ18300.1 hypothetical protein Spica_0132 [Gracilinema caldarium DSM 7334]
MTEFQWTEFQNLRQSYKSYVDELIRTLPQLPTLLSELIGGRSGPSYPLETPVVYNHALDDIQRENTIKVILVADNPGRREQTAAERRYLVGPSGKLAEGFFRQHPELGIDFRQHVLILNKTPIHTPRTVELRDLAHLGGYEIAEAIRNSQVTMASFIYQCHRIFAPEAELWIIGYSEMGRRKLFEAFTEALRQAYLSENADCNGIERATSTPAYAENSISRQRVYLYRHFSMNQFAIDFSKQQKPGESTQKTLHRIGSQYRMRILGW